MHNEAYYICSYFNLYIGFRSCIGEKNILMKIMEEGKTYFQKPLSWFFNHIFVEKCASEWKAKEMVKALKTKFFKHILAKLISSNIICCDNFDFQNNED